MEKTHIELGSLPTQGPTKAGRVNLLSQTGPEIRLLDVVIQWPHTLRSKESRSPHLSSVARHVE